MRVPTHATRRLAPVLLVVALLATGTLAWPRHGPRLRGDAAPDGSGSTPAELAPTPAAESGAVARDPSPPPAPRRPVHTYSIVARDSLTGELGVAVQSHWYSVGPIVPWAEAGVGAVATQSFIEPAYGPLGLDLMRAGRTADQALTSLLAGDPHPEVRQVAMVDARGGVAVWTGENAIIEAGHLEGPGFSVQANLMLKPTVWPAMAEAYRKAPGDLADRMLAALEAAEREGGDIRGRQSAALLIVRAVSTGQPWADRLMDLRVEDSADPVAELRRLVKLERAYDRMNAGDARMTENDIRGAVAEYSAAEELAPEVSEMVFWHAATLAGAGQVEQALPLFRRAFEADPKWAILTPRLPSAGLLPRDDVLIRRILSMDRAGAGLEEIG
ncbi:MAG: DUF1028 domain-containing protein, partial [Gemmatimonadetes bacterium]|nr:DUF1028 domain-containing protein [Gemmatimonadota bacterium]